MRRAWLLAGLLPLGACGGEAGPGQPPPPPTPLTDRVDAALAALPAVADPLAGQPPPALLEAAARAFCGNSRLEAEARRTLRESWPAGAAALRPLLADAALRGPLKARVLRFAADLGGLAATSLCRHALEARLDQDVEPRRLAVWLLGELGGPEELPVLVLRLKYEEYGDPEALAWTARSLARHGNLAGLPHLLALLGRPEERDRAAQVSREILGWEGRSGEGGEEELRRAAEGLAREWRQEGTSRRDRGNNGHPGLRRELLHRLARCREFNLRHRDDAVYILIRSGLPALPVLSEGLQDRHRDVRVASLEILRELGPLGRPLGELAGGLLRDPLAAPFAAEALGRIGHGPALPWLLFLAGQGQPDLRQACLLALGRLGRAEAMPVLETALADPDRAPEEGMAAALSLGLLGQRDRARSLLEAMKGRPEVHQETLAHHLEELRESAAPAGMPSPGTRPGR